MPSLISILIHGPFQVFFQYHYRKISHGISSWDMPFVITQEIPLNFLCNNKRSVKDATRCPGKIKMEDFTMNEPTRIALIGIIIEQADAVEPVNKTLHKYSEYIVGRMGIPYRERDINIISVVLDAPEKTISTLSGQLGMIHGATVKSMFTKKR